MKNSNIKVNPITETIEVSSTFLKKALIFDSPEWKELKDVRNAEPTFIVKEVNIPGGGSRLSGGC